MAEGTRSKEAWYAAADKILRKLKKENRTPTNEKELIKLLKEIGYEKTDLGKGDHTVYEFTSKEKLRSFLKEMDIKDVDAGSAPITKRVTVVLKNMKKGTISGVLDQVFGLDSLGQKPPGRK